MPTYSNYTIDYSDPILPGKTPFVINAETVDNTHTSLRLFGQGYVNYGEAATENYVRLLENFASRTAPLNPTIGQLWYDGNTNTLKIYNNTLNWVAISGGTSGITQVDADTRYVNILGDTMQGMLLLPTTLPTLDTHATNKAYVDAKSVLSQTSVFLTTNTPLAVNSVYSYSTSGLTITLPADPDDGDIIIIINTGTAVDCIIARNTLTIMGLSEDLVIDRPNIAVTLKCLGGTDWRVI